MLKRAWGIKACFGLGHDLVRFVCPEPKSLVPLLALRTLQPVACGCHGTVVLWASKASTLWRSHREYGCAIDSTVKTSHLYFFRPRVRFCGYLRKSTVSGSLCQRHCLFPSYVFFSISSPDIFKLLNSNLGAKLSVRRAYSPPCLLSFPACLPPFSLSVL